jgi:hypothetical protein
MESGDLVSTLKLLLRVSVIIVVLFLVSSYFLAMLVGPISFFFTEEGLSVSWLYPQRLLTILFTVIAVSLPTWLNVGTLFLLLLAVYTACFIAASRVNETFHQVVKSGFSHSVKKLFRNCLFAMPLIASMLLTGAMVIQGLQEAQGIPTGEPPLPEDPFKTFFLLTYSPLVEEVGFRISPIAAFLIVYLFLLGRRNEATLSRTERLKILVLAPLFPEKAKRRPSARTISDFGLKQGISLGEWIMVVWTSIVFGLSHYLSGGGWEIGKVTSASMVGLALGITYLVYGFQAPILLHWFFNYYFTAFDLASKLHHSIAAVTSISQVTTVLFGLAGWLSFTILAVHRGIHAIARRVKKG